jgi:hypothetical protein
MTLNCFTNILRIKFLSLLFLLSICNSINSQDYQYFNNRYDLNGFHEVDRSYNILETSDGYVIGGNSIVINGNNYWWETVFTKIDFSGEIIYIKYLHEDSVHYFFSSYPGFMILDSSQFYSVSIRRTPLTNWAHDEAMLVKLDSYLDTLWSKSFGEQFEPYDTDYWFTCLDKVQSDKLIIGGLWKPYGLASHAYLIMTDNSGQMIWEKSYRVGNYTQVYSVLQTSDQGFILGCVSYTPGYSITQDPVIIKTDSIGNQEWVINLGSQFMDNKAMVCQSIDSVIIVGTNYADSMYTSDASYSKINIVKIDNQGNIIWNKKYGASRPSNYLLNIRVLEDGNIISVGSLRKYNPEPDWVGWILKTDSDGDSLWYREYHYLSGRESSNYLYDIILTSDNGLIACGYVDPSPTDTGSTDTWVIKLDSIGCEFAGCDSTVGIEEPGGGEAWGHGGLYLWPNPAKTIVNCQLSNVDFQGDYSLVIYDIFGRPVLSSTPIIPPFGGIRGGPEGGRSWQINVESYPPGVYIAILKNDLDLLESRKFVVAH